MYRVGARGARRVDHGGDLEVALAGRGRPDADREVGDARVPRGRVRVRIDRDRLDAHLPARADDPEGNLAAIGYEEPLDVHDGGRFARKAFMPSCPSGDTRRPAMASMV